MIHVVAYPPNSFPTFGTMFLRMYAQPHACPLITEHTSNDSALPLCEAGSCKASLQVGVIRADTVFSAAVALETPQQVADAGLALTVGADGQIFLPIVAKTPQVDDVVPTPGNLYLINWA